MQCIFDVFLYLTTYKCTLLIENIFLLQFSTNLKYIRFFDRKLDFWRLYLQNVFDVFGVFIYKRKYCVNALSNLVTSSYKDDELCLATLPAASPDTFWIHHMKAKKKRTMMIMLEAINVTYQSSWLLCYWQTLTFIRVFQYFIHPWKLHE